MTTVRKMSNNLLSQPANYCSYLVRLWRTQHEVGWRASVQHVQTGEITRFADIDSLCRYLQAYASDDGARLLDEQTTSNIER